MAAAAMEAAVKVAMAVAEVVMEAAGMVAVAVVEREAAAAEREAAAVMGLVTARAVVQAGVGCCGRQMLDQWCGCRSSPHRERIAQGGKSYKGWRYCTAGLPACIRSILVVLQ